MCVCVCVCVVDRTDFQGHKPETSQFCKGRLPMPVLEGKVKRTPSEDLLGWALDMITR